MIHRPLLSKKLILSIFYYLHRIIDTNQIYRLIRGGCIAIVRWISRNPQWTGWGDFDPHNPSHSKSNWIAAEKIGQKRGSKFRKFIGMAQQIHPSIINRGEQRTTFPSSVTSPFDCRITDRFVFFLPSSLVIFYTTTALHKTLEHANDTSL